MKTDANLHPFLAFDQIFERKIANFAQNLTQI
jgi:hypothetical protein